VQPDEDAEHRVQPIRAGKMEGTNGGHAKEKAPNRGRIADLKENAEQLTQLERWRLILSAAFRVFLNGRVIGSTARLESVSG